MSDKLTIRVEREYEIDKEAWEQEFGLNDWAPGTSVTVDVARYLLHVRHPEAGDFPIYAVQSGVVKQTAFRVNGEEI